MTYKHCAFLSDNTTLRPVHGSLDLVHRCTSPECVWGICYPSHPNHPAKRKHIGDICPYFRIKSVMNSFGMRKEDGNGQMRT